MTNSQVSRRLLEAGIVDADLCGHIAQQSYYAERNGEDPEDVLQEAIMQRLAGGDAKKAVNRIVGAKRAETNIESMVDEDDDRDPYEFLEHRSTDNDRQDWIPKAGPDRVRMYLAIRVAMTKKPTLYHVAGASWAAVVQVMGRQFRVNGKRNEVVPRLREALVKIKAWCDPRCGEDGSVFALTCSRCGGPKSKYGVAVCLACYRWKSKRSICPSRTAPLFAQAADPRTLVERTQA